MIALDDFRSTHTYKHIIANGVKWEYITAGTGNRTILLLPGALSTAESMFAIITAFESRYKVITPSYNLSQNMTGLCEGIASILNLENANEVDVIGSSYGGLVAQYFVRRFPGKVKNLVIAHSFIIKAGLEKYLKFGLKLIRIIPGGVLRVLFKLKVKKMLFDKLKKINHPEKDMWRAYYSQAIDAGSFTAVSIHQNIALQECTALPPFHQHDLQHWDGRIFIIDSEDDPAVSKKDRNDLKLVYPGAIVYTFKDAGHVSFITKRELVIKLINNFLDGGTKPM